MVGYSIHLQKLNKAASAKSIGVRIGRFCIKNNIPVKSVATQFGITRQAVYNWFSGKSVPNQKMAAQISDLYPV